MAAFFGAQRRSLLLGLFSCLGLWTLSGCDSSGYSDAILYKVRTDPVIRKYPDQENAYPDTPGLLPIYQINQLDEERSPLHTFRKALSSAAYLDQVRDPALIKASDREALDAALKKHFGNGPAHPKLSGLEESQLEQLGLPKDTAKLDEALQKGSRLYRTHCLQCHGVTGDGRGPTAPWVNPHPRDFRVGLFKFQSVDQGNGLIQKASRDDLLRTLKEGIEGTAMPSFHLLPDPDLQLLVSYVIHLSIRGETELTIITDMKVAGNELKHDENVHEAFKEEVSRLGRKWAEAQGKPINMKDQPYPMPSLDFDDPKYQTYLTESVKRGFDLYREKCADCHRNYGRQTLYKFDAWGTMVRPANLTTGVYRGGRRPVDLYWRIHSGINGAGMPPFGAPPASNPTAVWDIVNFVRLLPYPRMLAKYNITIPQ